jgi:hypothetical protein
MLAKPRSARGEGHVTVDDDGIELCCKAWSQVSQNLKQTWKLAQVKLPRHIRRGSHVERARPLEGGLTVGKPSEPYAGSNGGRRSVVDVETNDHLVYTWRMAWIKVPPEHHAIFRAALPKDPNIETLQMFGGVAAKVNGNLFAGLLGRSTMVWLPERERAEALALEGVAMFDPMGDGRARSDKVMLPEYMMSNPTELRRWIARAFKGAAALPPKRKAQPKKPKNTTRTATPNKRRR